MLALLAHDAQEVLLNLAGLLGPVAVFALSDFIFSSRHLRHRQEYLNQLHVAIFATTAAGVSGTRFGGNTWQEILFLNASGAFVFAFLDIIIQHYKAFHQDVDRDDSVQVLEIFRTVFTGVWTTFAGMIIIAAQDLPDLGLGLCYFLGSMVAGVMAYEAGLRAGGRLNETVLDDEKGAKYIILLAHWLPYLCAYLGAVALFKHFTPALGFSYFYSYLACVTGDLTAPFPIDFQPKDYASYLLFVSNEMVANILAVSLVVGSRAYCAVAASRKSIALTACRSPALHELQDTYAGAVSVYCGSVHVAHSFVLSILPEDVKDDLYYDPRTPGSNSMRELGVEIVQDITGDSVPYSGALATRLLVEFSLIIIAFSVKLIVR